MESRMRYQGDRSIALNGKGILDEDENQPIATVLKPEHFGYLEPELDSPLIISSAKLQKIPEVRFHDTFLEKVAIAGESDQEWIEEYERGMSGNPSPGISYLHGSLYYEGRLWIPDEESLQKEILESEHDSKVAGHMGQDKTVELVRQNFFWPEMDKEICEYVASCLQCQCNKCPRHARYGLLHPLELPYAPWQSIAMDFITDLPSSNGYIEIWVIIDRFTKMAHFIPLKKDKKTAEDLALIFARNIWRLHGLLNEIISDHDRRFTSSFWSSLCNLLDICQKMSTLFQPETDG
jgi:hypothetical protein